MKKIETKIWYHLRNLKKFGNKNGTIREKYQRSQTKMVPFQKSAKYQRQKWYHFRKYYKLTSKKRFHLREFSPNLYEKSLLKRYNLSKRQSFATKKVLLEKGKEDHKLNWYYFIEEPKFGNKSGTILGKLPPIKPSIADFLYPP